MAGRRANRSAGGAPCSEHKRAAVPAAAQPDCVDESKPHTGDSILVLQQTWLDKILADEKTMEILHQPLHGRYWLGTPGVITGVAELGRAVPITSLSQRKALFPQHRWNAHKLHYKRTYGLPVANVRRVAPVQFQWKQGCIGTAQFAEMPAQSNAHMKRPASAVGANVARPSKRLRVVDMRPTTLKRPAASAGCASPQCVLKRPAGAPPTEHTAPPRGESPHVEGTGELCFACPGRSPGEPCVFSAEMKGAARAVATEGRLCEFCSEEEQRTLLQQKHIETTACKLAQLWMLDVDIAKQAFARLPLST